MLDTNVLISMILFPNEKFNDMLETITREHILVLSSFVVDELNAVVERKFPQRKSAADRFLAKLSFEYVYTPKVMKGGMFDIRDINDYPVLYTAVIENVDILITGDKDFIGIDIEKPQILTPAQFCEIYL